MVAKTTLKIDLKCSKSNGDYSYVGNLYTNQMQGLKNKEFELDYHKKYQKIAMLGRHFYSAKQNDSYVTETATMDMMMSDSDLSKGVISNYYEDGSQEGELKYNGDNLVVFPAETEEEALKILEEFDEYPNIYENTTGETLLKIADVNEK